MRNKILKIISVTMLFILGIMFIHQNVEAKSKKWFIVDSEYKKVKSITIVEGNTQKLQISSLSIEDIRWSSSNKKIVKVSKKGKITAKKKGKAKIYAENLQTNKKAVCKVTVKQKVEPKKIKITVAEKTCQIGQTIQLTATVSPKKATNKEIIWKSEDDTLASVDENGCVTAKGIGSCKIYAQVKGTEVEKSIKLKIKDVDVTKISTSYGEKGISLEHGEQKKLAYVIEPANVVNKAVSFKSANASIATVTEEGVVTAGRPGHTTITLKTNNGKKTTTVNITVTANKGLLTKNDLAKFDLTSIDNLMIVAHPDDETIWGGGHLVEDDYFVVCLTNGWNEKRANEFKRAIDAENDKGIILSYPDIEDGQRSDWKSVKTGILNDLKLILTYKKWKTVVTHNPQGEYGHQHHIMTNNYVTQTFEKNIPNGTCELLYFGRYYSAAKVGNYLTTSQKLNADTLQKKNKVLSYYASQQKIIGILSGMNPYEVWETADAWK